MHLKNENVKKIIEAYPEFKDAFPDNTPRKNYFLTACREFDPNCDIEFINTHSPFGGLIGVDNSYLDPLLKKSKILRVHAFLHDAAGMVKLTTGNGPGYSYVVPFPFNLCFVGHVFGISYCVYIKLIHPNLFHSLKC